MNLEIANRLQALRKEKGYSQEQLADALGISRQAISKWERAEASPDTDNLICLAKLYGVSLDELLSTDETIEEIKKDQELNNNDERKKEFKEHQKEDKSKIHKLVSNMVVSTYVVAAIIIFCVFGALKGLWHPLWILFLGIPVVDSIIECFFKRKITAFCYPVAIAIIYLLLGFLKNGWHPYWFLFLTIPLFYVFFEPLDKLLHRNDHQNDISNSIDNHK